MFVQPPNLAEALRMRGELGPDAVVVNGGTDVVVLLNRRQLRLKTIIDISRVAELQQIEKQSDGTLIIGAGVTYARLAELPLRAFREAALSVGGPSIRNMGTIGGNIVSASPAADGAVAALSLDAEVELSRAHCEPRWMPLTDFFVSYRKTKLQEDELLTRLRISGGSTSRWYKIGKRRAVNISVICGAVSRREGQYGIALGCVGPMPVAFPSVSQMLAGRDLVPELISEAADAVAREVNPISDHRASADYRRGMSRVVVKRLLTELSSEMAEDL